MRFEIIKIHTNVLTLNSGKANLQDSVDVVPAIILNVFFYHVKAFLADAELPHKQLVTLLQRTVHTVWP